MSVDVVSGRGRSTGNHVISGRSGQPSSGGLTRREESVKVPTLFMEVKERLKKELENIGLSEKEARVYLAALELGPSTAQQIAAKATVNRPTTYIMIESLVKRGLMSSFQKGKKKYFVCESLHALKEQLDQQIKELQDKKSNFLDLFSLFEKLSSVDERPKVTLFEGVQGIRQVQNDIVETAKKVKKIDNLVSVDHARKIIGRDELTELWNNLRDAGAQIRTIYTKQDEQDEFEEVRDFWKGRLLSVKQHPFNGEVSIYGDKVAALTYGTDVVGVLIENKNIAQTLSTLFELAWESLED